MLFKLFWRCLRPGLLRARYARLLLRNEPSPAYPYRGFFYLKYDLGDAFVLAFCCLNYLGDAF
ncbi:MAG: hypothetical protein EBQ77_10160 [Sphingobacteriia bacterium]|nr:hypothetical protein [Sphingobacteriia bacterium]